MSADTFFDDDSSELTVARVAPLTDRVNSEPAILKGLSATETLVAMAVFFPLWFVIGGLLALLFKRWQLLLLLGVIGPLVSVWVGGGFLAKFKRNRPDHFYGHAFVLWRHRLGLGRTPFTAQRGAWDLGRSMPVIAARQSWRERMARSLAALTDLFVLPVNFIATANDFNDPVSHPTPLNGSTMSKFVNALQQSQHENRWKFWLILIMAGLTAFAMWGWKTAPRDLTAHIPPDLRNGATINVGTTPSIPDTTVYTFAFYIWQQVNHWKSDGTKDYGDQLYALQSFLTPTCREQLVADMEQRSASGELSRRTRAVMEIPGLGYSEERVLVQGGNAWKVLLDTQVQETQANVPVKDAYIRYPLRVVRFDVDREKNPWQLAIDCFGGERPARLDAKAIAVSQAGHTVAQVRTDANAVAAPAPVPGPANATAPAAASTISPAILPKASN